MKPLFFLFTLVFPFLSMGQTPTNLVPPSARMPELRAWIDAEEQTGADGSLVTTVTDQAGVINGITVVGPVTLNIRNDGKKEFGFSGNDNFINLGKPQSLNFTPGTDEFTIMGLVGSGIPSQGTFVSKGNNSGSQYHIDISTSQFWTSVGGSSSQNYWSQTNGIVSENMHFAFVVKQNEILLYIDGQLIGSKIGSSIGTSTFDEDVWIGTDNSQYDWEYSDHIRNIGLFAKALSISEIQVIYNDLNSPSNDTQSPTAPTLTSAEKTDTTVNLSWSGATDNVGVVGYNVYRDGTIFASNISSNTYQASGLNATTSYDFMVRALDAVGNESANSNVLNITTDSSTGTGEGSSNGSIWSESNSIASYSGNVAIGRSSVPSGYKMAVEGKIRTREVRVDQENWPDYVFEEDYNLPTLEEIRKHIYEHGHLPDVPSASNVEANGIELGEMNRLLLKKIEEMTLYILFQEQRITQLEDASEKN